MDSRNRKRNRETDSEFTKQKADSRNRQWIRETDSEFAKQKVNSQKRQQIRASIISFAHSLFFREIIICFAQTLYREYTTKFANSLSASQIHYLFRAFNIVSANSLFFSLIHYLFRDSAFYCANQSSFSQIYYLFLDFIVFVAHSLSPRIYITNFINSHANSLSVSLDYKSTIFFANLLSVS